MGIYADYRDIDAQINSLLNRSAAGQFSAVGDTSDSADARYSNDLVTEARRKAAYKIFQAIGSNPSHPYWADLMELYAVDHNDPIPVHFGEIGIPIIAPNETGLVSHATGSLSVVGSNHATGSLTVIDPSVANATGYITVTKPAGHSTGTLTLKQGVAASGTLNVTGTPSPGETLVVNGNTITFLADPNTASEGQIAVEIFSDRTVQARAIATVLTSFSSGTPTLDVATYDAISSRMNVFYKLLGVGGNAFTLVGSAHVAAVTATLTGGTDGVLPGEVVYVNGTPCVFGTAPLGGPDAPILYLGDPKDSAVTNAQSLYYALRDAPNVQLTVATYAFNSNVVTITHTRTGAIGNLYGLEDSNLGHITASAHTLTGGTGGISEGETVTLGNSPGVTYTFSNVTSGTTFIEFSETDNAAETAALIVEHLNASADSHINVATYTVSLPPPPSTPRTDPDRLAETLRSVKIVYDTVGPGGNSFALNNSSILGILAETATLVGGFTTGIASGSTLTVNGVTYTFSNVVSALNIPFGTDIEVNATNIASKLNASANILLSVATYTPVGNVVNIRYDSAGAVGNTFTLADSAGSNAHSVRASSQYLEGGELNIVDGETLSINHHTVTFTYPIGIDPEDGDTELGTGPITPGSTPILTALNLANYLNASTHEALIVATYEAVGSSVNITYATPGGNDFALANSSSNSITRSAATLSGGGEVDEDKYTTAIPADPDWIDSARNNVLGMSSDYFGTGRVNHNEDLDDGVASPLAGRYATPNGVMKFTGFAAKIPLIKIPFDDDPNVSALTNVCVSTEDSGIILSEDSTFDSGMTGLLAVITDSEFNEIGRGVITSVTDNTTFSIEPEVCSGSFNDAIYTFYTVTPTAVQAMADTKIPLELSALNAKLALPMCVKEGDNLYRTAQWLGSEGERELMLLKAGATKVAPIDVTKLTQFGQKYSN